MIEKMESLPSSQELVYGNFERVLLEDDENAAEGMQYILDVLNTDYKDFQDILRLTQ